MYSIIKWVFQLMIDGLRYITIADLFHKYYFILPCPKWRITIHALENSF